MFGTALIASLELNAFVIMFDLSNIHDQESVISPLCDDTLVVIHNDNWYHYDMYINKCISTSKSHKPLYLLGLRRFLIRLLAKKLY